VVHTGKTTFSKENHTKKKIRSCKVKKKLGLTGNGFSRSMYDILMRNSDLFVRCKKEILLDQNLYM
jgi:hypothetical protein